MAKLILKFKDAKIREVPITKPSMTIGRMERNDIMIKNMAVSRQHARIIINKDRFIIEDLDSMNGIFVNEKKVKQCILKDKDEILVGKHTLIFVNEDCALIEIKKEIDIPLAEKTLILDTQKQRELISQPGDEGPTTMQEPIDLKGGISIISGGTGQKDIELTKRLTVGGKSKSAEIRLKGFFVGKTAFIISRKPQGYFITHSGGAIMTRVNGEEVKGECELMDGDMIEIGSTKMQFYIKN